MKITTIGRGKIGGGMADLWERAGHEVTRLGHEGGDVGQEAVIGLAFGIANEGGMGQFFYKFAPPSEL
jgi:8-hydroxy-5-deazaflavin:NADPH oxidoreductase